MNTFVHIPIPMAEISDNDKRKLNQFHISMRSKGFKLKSVPEDIQQILDLQCGLIYNWIEYIWWDDSLVSRFVWVCIRDLISVLARKCRKQHFCPLVQSRKKRFPTLIPHSQIHQIQHLTARQVREALFESRKDLYIEPRISGERVQSEDQ